MCCSYGTKSKSSDMIPSYTNGSGYKWKFLKAKRSLNDSFWINISVHDLNGDMIKSGTSILTLCKKVNLENGEISIKLSNSDIKRQLKVTSLGYFSVETKPFPFQTNDSVEISFKLAEDDRPIINCE